MISPRGNYVTLLKSRRNKSIEKTREAYLGHKNIRTLKLEKTKNFSCENQKLKLSNRKNSLNKSHSLNRNSTSKLETLTSRQVSKDRQKKDFTSWAKTCSSLSKQSYEDERKKNKQGYNCRLVVMVNGKVQNEHFVAVEQIQNVRKYLANAYLHYGNFLTIPRQISLQFFLTQSSVSGQFLNGQTIYFKPQPHYPYPETVKMQDFQIIKQIGSGGFSKVFLCRSKFDNNFYAMKLIEKQMVIKNKKKKILMNERIIMEKSKHPFIIELKYAFESEKYLVFILQYCAGGQLFGLIRKYRRLNEDIARFYIIEIFLGLSYLHSQKVVYRDIKPENILLGIDGHVKIADLGLAKPNMNEGELAYSFCGSPEYMSPQMIMQVGHTYPVDFYCMGALLYELLIGLPPFYSQDPQEIYQAVLVEELSYPQDVNLTPQCKSLLKSLLCKDPKQRLGSLYGTKQILAHPWFGKQKYQDFLERKVQPPLNFKNLEKLNLDLNVDDKNKQSLEKVVRDQKHQKKQFKQIMKNFYYDFSPQNNNNITIKDQNRKINSPRLHLTQRQKQNIQSIKRAKKKATNAILTRNPLQKVFQK